MLFRSSKARRRHGRSWRRRPASAEGSLRGSPHLTPESISPAPWRGSPAWSVTLRARRRRGRSFRRWPKWRELSAVQPTPIYQRQLAIALDCLAIVTEALEGPSAAWPVRKEEADVLRMLAEKEPTPRSQRDLASVVGWLGGVVEALEGQAASRPFAQEMASLPWWPRKSPRPSPARSRDGMLRSASRSRRPKDPRRHDRTATRSSISLGHSPKRSPQPRPSRTSVLRSTTWRTSSSENVVERQQRPSARKRWNPAVAINPQHPNVILVNGMRMALLGDRLLGPEPGCAPSL